MRLKQTGFATHGMGLGPTWETCVERCLASLDHVRGGANVGFLYVSDCFSQDINAIRERVLSATGVSALVGTASAGVCCTGQEFMDEPAIVLLLLRLPEGSFVEVRPQGGEHWHFDPLDERASLGIAHGDMSDGEALSSVLVSDCFMVGGVAASGGPTRQIATTECLTGSTNVLVLGAEVSLRAGMTQGCSPLGPVRRVTRSVRNVLLTLDDEPALQLLLQDCAPVAREGNMELGGQVFAAVHLENRDQQDYVVRALLGANPLEDAVAIAAEPHLGDRIQFVRRDPEAARKDMVRMLEEVATAGTPAAGLYFSCVARGERLFDAPSVELELIVEHLGDFPLVGFFGNGELYRRHMYGHTGVLVVFHDTEA